MQTILVAFHSAALGELGLGIRGLEDGRDPGPERASASEGLELGGRD